jgi:cubilin
MYSKTGSITIFSTAINGVGFRSSSFSLQYFGVPVGATNLLNNTYATLNMGAASIVPFLSNGILPAYTTQRWAIRTSTQIVFSFSNFNFPDDCSATIQIHNRLTGTSSSSLMFSGCRASDIPSAWLYSSTGTALVVVTTAAQDSAVKFQLNYFSDMTLYACGSFVQPAVTTDTSMIIADGSLSTALMQTGQSCTWQVIPGTNTPLNLIMNRVSLKFGSSVTVYDGSSTTTSRRVLWRAVGATETVPPVITATGNALFIQYASDSSNAISYRGFQGDYYPNFVGSTGSGKGYTQLQMSSALDVTPPGDGTTHSPGVRYIWYVSPIGSTGPITFAVQLLRLLQPGSTLTILEGDAGNTGGDLGGVAQSYDIGSRTVLATYSGDQIPDAWVRTSGTSATLIFQSNNTVAAPNENFKIAYYSDGPNYHCGFTTNPASLDLQSFILTDGSSSVEKVYGNQLCQWKIQPRAGYAIVLVFSRFHLFGGALRIFSGSEIASSKLFVEIGETAAPPAPIVIEDSALSLQYSTSQSPSGYGFSMTYYAVADSRSFPGDNIVTLRSSSVVALTLPLDSQSTLAPGTNLTWLITPTGASGRIYFAISLLDLSTDCARSYLDVYDGTDADAPLLARYCGNDLPLPYSWLQTSAGTAKVQFKTDESVGNTGNFELAYFADGPNFHCGFAVNPARMTAPSMVFSDGSGSASPLYSDQLCEWIIEPNAVANSAPAPTGTVIVVEFMQCDLAGAKIELYDGASDSARLLWSCDGCDNNPGPVISSSNSVFVRFTSYSEATFGQGFQLMYWTASAASLARNGAGVASHLLYLPTDFTLASGALNTSAAFFLGTTTTPASLFFSPFYGLADGGIVDVSSSARDGRASPSVFEIPASQQSVCGAVLNAGNNRLVDETLTYTTSQRLGSFLTTTAGSKSLTAVRGVDRSSRTSYDKQRAESYFSVPTVCKYRLDSGSHQAVAIEITNFSPQNNGHLRVYGGLDSQDALLFDSYFPERYLRWPSRYVGREENGVWLQSVNVTAPCGQATVVVETNSTAGNGTRDDTVDYSLHFVYYAIAADSGQECSAYCKIEMQLFADIS